MMSVYDFLSYFINIEFVIIKIWSTVDEKIIWQGEYDEIPSEILCAELCSIDNPFIECDETLTVNVDISERELEVLKDEFN